MTDPVFNNSNLYDDQKCPLESMIVPAYNVEVYLDKCLQSMKAQVYTEY